MARPLLSLSLWMESSQLYDTYLHSFQTVEWPGLSSDRVFWPGPRGLANRGYELETFLLRLKTWCSIKQLVTGILQHVVNVVLGLGWLRMKSPGAPHWGLGWEEPGPNSTSDFSRTV